MNRLMVHAMCAMMPTAAGLPGLGRAEALAYTQRLRREADPLYLLGLVLGAVVFALTPLLTVYRPLPSFLLSARTLDLHAQRVVAHPAYLLKQAVFLVRLNAGMAWGAHPDSRGAFGLAPYAADPGSFRGQDGVGGAP